MYSKYCHSSTREHANSGHADKHVRWRPISCNLLSQALSRGLAGSLEAVPTHSCSGENDVFPSQEKKGLLVALARRFTLSQNGYGNICVFGTQQCPLSILDCRKKKSPSVTDGDQELGRSKFESSNLGKLGKSMSRKSSNLRSKSRSKWQRQGEKLTAESSSKPISKRSDAASRQRIAEQRGTNHRNQG